MIAVVQILSLHAEMVERWHDQPVDNPFEGILGLICQQHQFNFLLWHQEDIARSPSVTDSEIAQVKRAIDKLNQQRNDWIEKIDDAIDERLHHLAIQPSEGASIRTETPGSVIDRLSIGSLRLYHLIEQLDRIDVDADHISRVEEKIEICRQQKRHLARGLEELLKDISTGAVIHRTYRQCKMYNDPTLNPYLYARPATRKSA